MPDPLTLLKKKYPSALYNYFRVTNFDTALQKFLADTSVNPKFTYPPILKKSYIEIRKNNLKADIALAKSTPAKKFLKRRLIETQILEIFWQLRKTQTQTAQHKKLVSQYHQQMSQLYKPPKREYFDGAMCQVYDLAHRRQKLKSLSVLEQSLHWNGIKLYQPTLQTYEYYKNLLKRTAPELFAVQSNRFNIEKVAFCLESFMHQYQLIENGWKLIHKQSGSNVMVSGLQKKVYMSDKFRPKNKLRLRQIVGHEIFAHARRVEFGTVKAKNFEEEGLAIVIEQLLAQNYSHKRLIRYLVVCLAYGVDGNPRDFKETYRLALPITQIVTGSSKKDSQTTAFRECLRVFRGGNPDIAGVVFTKDKVYLESALAVWKKLEPNKLSQTEFSDILASHATIWSKQD